MTASILNMRALLIGVDFYLPNMLPDGNSYGSLSGCVRDVDLVQTFLTGRLGVNDQRIQRLTAKNNGTSKLAGAPESWPTYENMVAAIQQLTDESEPGEIVHIHYSGHGGRTPTLVPDQKGKSALDEAMVPPDIGDSTSRYLRDIELAVLLKRMVNKGLIVSVVLDCCHSGGMTRGPADVAVRGISSIDTTARPPGSLVGTVTELGDTWLQPSSENSRAVTTVHSWLSAPQGYVLLSACRSVELAHESSYDGKERNGALTWWLFDSLHEFSGGVTWKQLHDRVLPKVHSDFQSQTPQLQGEGDRFFLGAERGVAQHAVPVLTVGSNGKNIQMNAGQSHGIRRGAVFAVYPHGTATLSDESARLAIVEVREVEAVHSWADVTESFSGQPVEAGAQAVMIDPGRKRVRGVALVRNENLPPDINQDEALSRLKSMLSGSRWVDVTVDSHKIDFQVALAESSEFDIRDRAGLPIRHLGPALKIDDQRSAKTVAERLTHLAKHHSVVQLDNQDATSRLNGKLLVELVGRSSDFEAGEPFEPEPFDDRGHSPVLTVGEWTAVRIRNDSTSALNVTVFDLQPGWGIQQIDPWDPVDCFVTMDPGEERVLPLEAGLPEGMNEGTDIIKVFATIEPTNFRWLQLPSLFGLDNRNSVPRGAPANPLEEFLQAMMADAPTTRHAIPPSTGNWTTTQVELTVRRRFPS